MHFVQETDQDSRRKQIIGRSGYDNSVSCTHLLLDRIKMIFADAVNASEFHIPFQSVLHTGLTADTAAYFCFLQIDKAAFGIRNTFFYTIECFCHHKFCIPVLSAAAYPEKFHFIRSPFKNTSSLLIY